MKRLYHFSVLFYVHAQVNVNWFINMDVTLEECKCAVRNYYETDVDVVAYHEEPLGGPKAGHLGEYYILTVQTRCGKKATMFVKKILSSPNRPEFVNLVTNKEITYYNYIKDLEKILPDLDFTFMPKIFHTSSKLMIMEDLGAECYKSVKSVNENHVDLCLKTLSKLHATTITYQQRIGGDFQKQHWQFLQESNFSDKDNFVGNLYISNITTAVNKLISYLNVDMGNLFNAAIDNTLKVINNRNTFLNVCCHGDLWCNNILFKTVNNIPVDCKIIDFQLLRYAPPAHDVTTFIFHNCDRELIQMHLHEFYKKYYSYLSNELTGLNLDVSTLLPWLEFEETCRIFTKVAKITKLIYKSFEAATKKRILSKAQKGLDEIMDEDFIVEMIEVDANLRADFKSQLRDVREMLTTPIILREDIYKMISVKFPGAEYKLVDYSVARCARPINLHEVYFDLNININIDKKLSDVKLVLKTPTANNGERFQQEVRFLHKYTVDVLPTYLLVCRDFIAHENLSQQGYEHLNRRKPFTLDEVKLVIQAMVKLHYCGFNKGSSNTSRNMERIYESMKTNPDLLKIVKELIERTEVKQDIIPATYCHGYLNHANILFKFNGVQPIDCKLINGNYRYSTPTYDFMSLLYATTTKSFRKYFLNDLQRFYYEKLNEVLKSTTIAFTFENFVDQCEVDRVWAILDNFNYHQNALIEERLCIAEYDAINMFCWENDRTTMVSKMCNMDPIYKSKLDEVSSEIIELSRYL